MKKLSLLLMLISAVAIMGCEDEEITRGYTCLEGEVIGKIRTGGGGLAVSLKAPIDNSITWQDRDNVIELLNIPVEYTVEGTTIYFTAREAREGERGPVTADGDESIQLILYGTDFSNQSCTDIDY